MYLSSFKRFEWLNFANMPELESLKVSQNSRSFCYEDVRENLVTDFWRQSLNSSWIGDETFCKILYTTTVKYIYILKYILLNTWKLNKLQKKLDSQKVLCHALNYAYNSWEANSKLIGHMKQMKYSCRT